jgi:hypothetical protein
MGGFILDALKGGEEIPADDPFREGRGFLRLAEIYKALHQPTIEQIRTLIQRLLDLTRNFITKTVRWIIDPLMKLGEFAILTITRCLHTLYNWRVVDRPIFVYEQPFELADLVRSTELSDVDQLSSSSSGEYLI